MWLSDARFKLAFIIYFVNTSGTKEDLHSGAARGGYGETKWRLQQVVNDAYMYFINFQLAIFKVQGYIYPGSG